MDDDREDRGGQPRLIVISCPTCHTIIEVVPGSIAWCSHNGHKTARMKEVKREEAEGR